METFEAIRTRVSVREYEPRDVERELLEKLVDAGRRAPSARAVEPWEFVVITRRETLKQLGSAANTGAFIKDAAAAIIVFCRDTKYYLEDGCAAAENILLAAADAGLGACWVAGDKKPYTAQVCAMFGAPAGVKLVSIISLGWPAAPAEQVKHRALTEVIHWEKF